jgi:hypothetical protein
VTTLAAGTSGLTGATYALYQLGHYGCNCWEGQWIDGDHSNGINLWGDYYMGWGTRSNTTWTYYANFWVR